MPRRLEAAALSLIACLACGPDASVPAGVPGGLLPQGPVLHTLQDASFVGMLPGPDGFVGTGDDVPLAGANPAGSATFSTTLGTALGDVTTFFDGSASLPRPVALVGGSVSNTFSVDLRGLPTFGFPGNYFSLPNPPPSASASIDGLAQTVAFTLGGCFDATSCDPAAPPLDVEFDLELAGVTLARGVDPGALVGIDADEAAYLDQLIGLAPADWTAIQLVRSGPEPITADNARGLFADVFIGGEASGVTAYVTSDPFRVGPSWEGRASAAGDDLLQTLDGEVHPAGLLFATPFAPVGLQAIGSFSFASASADDFRVTPGTVEVQVLAGDLEASATRTNGARRVDPASGRPLRGDAAADATCSTGAEPDCWIPGDPRAQNAALFDAICAWNRGFTTLDSDACALDIFNSQAVANGLKIADVFGIMLTGDPSGVGLAASLVAVFTGVLLPAADIPLVDLGLADRTGDGMPDDPINDGFAGFFPSLHRHLPEPAQQALLGCGAFVGQGGPRPCDDLGISLFDAEASALVSAWFAQPGFDPTSLAGPMPGTEAFLAVTDTGACRRFAPSDFGDVTLPGCRRPCRRDSPFTIGGVVFPPCHHSIYAGYDAAVDGDPTAIGVNEAGFGATSLYDCPLEGDDGWCDTGHPFTGERWSSVMDAFSWNLQVVLTLLSTLGAAAVDTDGDGFAEFDAGQFDPADALRADGCSFRRPDLCASVDGLWGLTVGLHRDGPEGPPLRRWVWESGAQYRVDSASDRLARYEGGVLHASGPAVGSLDVPMLLLEDRDGDGVTDEVDDCWGVANPRQVDADGDGIGNRCDCDFDGDGACNLDDFSLFLPDLLAGASATGATDMNADGTVNLGDFALFLAGFREGKPGLSALVPGPSATFTGRVRQRWGIPSDGLGGGS